MRNLTFFALTLGIALTWLIGSSTAAEVTPLELAAQPDPPSFREIRSHAERYFANRDKGRGSGYKQYKRWESFMEPRVYPSGKFFNVAAKTWLEYHRHLESDVFPKTQAIAAAMGYSDGNWTAIGPIIAESAPGAAVADTPGLGRVNDIAFDGPDIYVGTPAGGLWRSKDHGTTWTPLTDGLPAIGVSGIVVAPDRTLFILTGDGDKNNTRSIGVLRSEDDGKTWQPTGLMWGVSDKVTGYKLISYKLSGAQHGAFDFEMWAATSQGLFRSTDGKTWKPDLAGDVRDVELSSTGCNATQSSLKTVYAVKGNQIWVLPSCSRDKWVPITQYRTGTGCASAAGLPPPDTKGLVRIELAIGKSPTGFGDYTIYALYGGDGNTGLIGLYKSDVNHLTSGSEEWKCVSNSPNILGYSKTGIDQPGSSKSQAAYDLAMVVSPLNKDEIHVGGINTWRSLDGGVTWGESTSQWNKPGTFYTHADIHDLEFDSSGNLYTASDGGVYQSSNSSKSKMSWTNKSNGLQITQIYRLAGTPQNSTLLYFGAQDNGSSRLHRTTQVASQVYQGDGGQTRIDRTNADIVYLSNINGNLQKSTDGGKNFTLIQPAGSTGAWTTPFVIHPTKPNTLVAGYKDVWRTKTGGLPWNNISNGAVGTEVSVQVAIAVSNTKYMYVAKAPWWGPDPTHPSGVYQSDDNGSSWTNITHNLPVDKAKITDLAVNPEDALDVRVTLGGYASGKKVYRYDGNTSWENFSGGLPNLPANTIAFEEGNSETAVYIGMDVGVYYSDDKLSKAGVGWIPFMNEMPNVIVYDLELDQASKKIRAATFGRGVWEADYLSPCPENYTLASSSQPPVFGIIDYRAKSKIVSSISYPGSDGTEIRYQSGGSISLGSGFAVGVGAKFTASIESCPESAPLNPTSYVGPSEIFE